ncbi:MAG: efflux RND transporter periplasmic adaptor subunit [Chloroflexi bacterium]|nr:efflux RND transporter periplasmic adaptor subunit [Chloroflexota bacterium]
MRKTITITVIVIVLASAFIGYRGYSRRQQNANLLDNLQTEPAEIGSLVATVGATGTVRANQTVYISWQTSGIVAEVTVSVGDDVTAEDALANLVHSSLPQNVILAEADLVTAEKALEDLYEAHSEIYIVQAEQQITEAEKTVQTAERLVYNLSAPGPQTSIDQAQAHVVLALNKLERAQDNYDPYANKPENNLVRASLLSQLAQARNDYDAAVRLYNALTGTASELDMAIAQADLELVRAQLAEALDELARLEAGPTEEDINAAQIHIAAVEATLSFDHIEAPFDGTVTQINHKTGDLVSPSEVAFRLDDLSRLLVDLQVSEIDINRIEVGQTVSLIFDAILETEYEGKVIEVGLVGSNDQGVVNFNVTVELLNADEALKPGMTAAVNIVVNELEEALLVPNRAVRVLDGHRVVYVLQATGRLETVIITLGFSTDTHSEVLETELQVGDLIVLNPPTDFFSEPGSGGGGGFFGGGRR